MTTATPSSANVVHESIDERQFVRTRIPARVTLTDSNGKALECEIKDLSLGGMGLDCDSPLAVGGLYDATLFLNLNAIDLTIDTRLKVVSQRESVVGAEFVDLDPKKRDILRYLMSAYMSGEIVDISGLVNVMQRESYIKSRKQKTDHVRSLRQRLQAAAGTLLFVCLGLLALVFIVYKTYMMLFHIPAAQAQVSADAYVISMPDNGYLKYSIAEGQTSVSRGEPIATVSSQLASRLNTPADIGALSNLSQQDLQMVLGRALIETVISSPCDCDLYFPGQRLDSFAYHQQPLVHLLPKDRPLYVTASVPFGKLNDIRELSSIRMNVFGIDESIGGSIIDAHADNETGLLQLKIQPDQPLPLSSYQKPVAVDLFLSTPGVRN
ncbi:PilZ domain-containing protein [Pseudomonas mangrovi]|uniref:Pilus assembly protein PilZ n=1 Tax=Pseudomonas mangrovi TaxID=2161748 RepID=A0A2T5P902_9PSED|nr:PilZ domain-containing protein [Pseudomonas mangrovi]PTU74212.1 pilus assembly protein PilZ [Pseudomonas mangrovi]